MININSQIFYYLLIFLILTIFLISIQFRINFFYNTIKKLFKFLFSKKEKNYTNENEIISEFIPQDEIKSLIQDDLPFIKSENKDNNKKIRFKLPSVDLLKIPTEKGYIFQSGVSEYQLGIAIIFLAIRVNTRVQGFGIEGS